MRMAFLACQLSILFVSSSRSLIGVSQSSKFFDPWNLHAVSLCFLDFFSTNHVSTNKRTSDCRRTWDEPGMLWGQWNRPNSERASPHRGICSITILETRDLFSLITVTIKRMKPRDNKQFGNSFDQFLLRLLFSAVYCFPASQCTFWQVLE